MSTKKIESGYSNIQEKRRIKVLIASQKGLMNKFIKIDMKNELENINGSIMSQKDQMNQSFYLSKKKCWMKLIIII